MEQLLRAILTMKQRRADQWPDGGEGNPYQASAGVEENGKLVDDPKITQLRIGTCLNIITMLVPGAAGYACAALADSDSGTMSFEHVGKVVMLVLSGVGVGAALAYHLEQLQKSEAKPDWQPREWKRIESFRGSTSFWPD